MDTQKDFIHIDDLFKDLRNGEEHERSGSWLHMKELLDKEMPVGTAISGGRSFRRFIIPLVAALALIGGGIGYRELSKDKTNKAQLALENSNSGVTPSGTDASHNLVAGSSNRNILPERNNNDNGNGSSAVTGSSSRRKEAGSPSSSVNNSVAGSSSGKSARSGGAQGNNSQSKTSGNSTANKARTQQHTAAGKRGDHHVPAHKAIAENHDPAADKIIEERVIEQIEPVQKTQKNNQALASASGASSTLKGAKTIAAAANSKDLKQLAFSLNNKKIVRDADGTLYKEERDTFKRIDLVERIVAGNSVGRKGPAKTVLDTVAVTRVEKVRYVPLDRMEIANLRQIDVNNNPAKLIPVTNLHDRILSSNEMVSLVPLTQYKVASRRVDPGKFNQMIQNTSAGISNYFDGSRNFYAAILVGGNTSFGNPGAFGMQVGIAGLYSLGERLTLAAELKYVNHYFSNYSVEDKSVTFENVSSQQLSGLEWLFSGTQNTVTSAYKINSFGALEMPVTLNYNLGRISVFGGLNMAYAFPIKWSKENTYNTTSVQQTRTQNENPFRDASFQVNEQQDFASRFGLGYVWGLNYDISRKVSLDARVAQILWDNNKSNTDAINRLFRIPTLQFSFGYYFGRKDKVIYIMDKR